MLYERRVKVKLDLTLQQPFTNVVITLCASWVVPVSTLYNYDINKSKFVPRLPIKSAAFSKISVYQ